MRNPAFAFAMEVERQLGALTSEDFHMRRGHAKVLREEWYPIARLALHLKQPGLDIDVEAFGSDGPADGRIVERGFREREFDVQVTYAFDYKDSLRSEHLVKHGSVPGTGAITRDKKSGSVVAEMAAVDVDYNVQKAATEIAERFRKKVAKPARRETALIIAFEDMTLRGYYAWRSLLSLVENQVDLAPVRFRLSMSSTAGQVKFSKLPDPQLKPTCLWHAAYQQR